MDLLLESPGRGIHTRLSSLGPATPSSGNVVLEPEVGRDHSASSPAEDDPDATIHYCLNPVGPRLQARAGRIGYKTTGQKYNAQGGHNHL